MSTSRNHPPAVIQRRQERDLRFILPLVANLTEEQYRLLLFFQALVVRHAASALPPLLDQDVVEGAAATAATLETAGKGIIYQHQAASIPAQRLTEEFGRALADILSRAGSTRAKLERDAAVALRQLERGATLAARELADDEAPVYVRLLGRIMQPARDDEGSHASRPSTASDPQSRLIIPG